MGGYCCLFGRGNHHLGSPADCGREHTSRFQRPLAGPRWPQLGDWSPLALTIVSYPIEAYPGAHAYVTAEGREGAWSHKHTSSLCLHHVCSHPPRPSCLQGQTERSLYSHTWLRGTVKNGRHRRDLSKLWANQSLPHSHLLLKKQELNNSFFSPIFLWPFISGPSPPRVSPAVTWPTEDEHVVMKKIPEVACCLPSKSHPWYS